MRQQAKQVNKLKKESQQLDLPNQDRMELLKEIQELDGPLVMHGGSSAPIHLSTKGIGPQALKANGTLRTKDHIVTIGGERFVGEYGLRGSRKGGVNYNALSCMPASKNSLKEMGTCLSYAINFSIVNLEKAIKGIKRNIDVIKNKEILLYPVSIMSKRLFSNLRALMLYNPSPEILNELKNEINKINIEEHGEKTKKYISRCLEVLNGKKIINITKPDGSVKELRIIHGDDNLAFPIY